MPGKLIVVSVLSTFLSFSSSTKYHSAWRKLDAVATRGYENKESRDGQGRNTTVRGDQRRKMNSRSRASDPMSTIVTHGGYGAIPALRCVEFFQTKKHLHLGTNGPDKLRPYAAFGNVAGHELAHARAPRNTQYAREPTFEGKLLRSDAAPNSMGISCSQMRALP
ncbi:hypothetical protein [Cupriavidus sp. CuC1]|uniref:hypothetical protein n=1 Tax=Cupriavidus sp. CuC1 TaxID=3373131 RepID=UPI0037D91137